MNPDTTELFQRLAELTKKAKPVLEKEVAKPDPSDDIFEQRSYHRKVILWLAFGLTIASFLLITGLLIWQGIIIVLYGPTIRIVRDAVIQTLAVSIFVEVLGVIYIIANSIWNDKDYIDILKSKLKK